MNVAQVVVIEDDEGIRRLVLDMLAEDGVEAVGLGDGQTAINYLAGRDQPRLILLDKRMPGMDGLEFASVYGSLVAAPAPLVLLSASIEPEVLPQGISGYLQKPFDMDRLLRLTRTYLS